jgi:hypothetical protein
MYIWSEEELKKFINLLPNLEEGNIYFLSLSARKKYLTEEEREFFDLGRTEMFGRRLTSKENYIKTVKELDDFACNYTTRNEKIIPGKSLVFYANINPSSGLQAAEMFNNELNKLVFDSFYNKQVKPKFARLDKLLMNCYQVSRTNKFFIDIDCDCPFSYIIPVIQDLHDHEVDFNVIKTKSGYHILITRSTLKYNFTTILKEQNEKLLGERGKGEIVINKNGMIPIPGTLQSGSEVKFLRVTV